MKTSLNWRQPCSKRSWKNKWTAHFCFKENVLIFRGTKHLNNAWTHESHILVSRKRIYMNSNDKKYEFVMNYEYFMQISYADYVISSQFIISWHNCYRDLNWDVIYECMVDIKQITHQIICLMFASNFRGNHGNQSLWRI